MTDYLTTKEVAALLRIKERKVYDLAASGEIPCSRAFGKLLFARGKIEAWLAGSDRENDDPGGPVPNVFLGSHDPLLEWALRECECAIATLFDSSLDGLERMARGEGIAAGLHLVDAKSEDWNVGPAKESAADRGAVLVTWAWRSRGLLVRPPDREKFSAFEDIAGAALAARQELAGSQRLLMHLLEGAGLAERDLTIAITARTEQDAALAVVEKKADVTFGLEAIAAQFGLAFVPIAKERFDLLVNRRAWFDTPFQTFLAFCASSTFETRASELAGYDISELGHVRHVGP